MGEAHASWSRHRKRCLRGRRTESLFIELDRSFQTDAWAKPTRPGAGTASGASVAAEQNLYPLSSTGHFQTDAWAQPTRPGVGTASGASVAAEQNLYPLSSTGHFRRTR